MTRRQRLAAAELCSALAYVRMAHGYQMLIAEVCEHMGAGPDVEEIVWRVFEETNSGSAFGWEFWALAASMLMTGEIP